MPKQVLDHIPAWDELDNSSVLSIKLRNVECNYLSLCDRLCERRLDVGVLEICHNKVEHFFHDTSTDISVVVAQIRNGDMCQNAQYIMIVMNCPDRRFHHKEFR